jgi:hypothetical protein
METLTESSLTWLDRCFGGLAPAEKPCPALSCLVGKLPDDPIEDAYHAGIATRAVSVTGVGEIGPFALLASMPFVVHAPLFSLGGRLEAPELVSYLATSEERLKHGGLTLGQCFSYLLLHELPDSADVDLRLAAHPWREDDFRVRLPSSILLLLEHR